MNKRDEAQEFVKSGEAAREAGCFTKAEEYLQKAQWLYEELDDPKGLAQAWGHLGLNSQLQGLFAKASWRFGRSLLCALEAGDRGTVAIALRHLGKIQTMDTEDIPDKGLGIFLLRASVLGAPGSRAHRAWFRHGLAGAYFQDGKRLRGFWQLLLSLVDLGLGWKAEPNVLAKRAWLTGALLDLGQIPFVGRFFNQTALDLATKWDLEIRRQEALRALGMVS